MRNQHWKKRIIGRNFKCLKKQAEEIMSIRIIFKFKKNEIMSLLSIYKILSYSFIINKTIYN